MKTNNDMIGRWAMIAILCCLMNSAWADQFGNFTYSDNGTSITITDYPESSVGALVIPESIAGKPVTQIGEGAFYQCAGLTSVVVPDSVTSIGEAAFLWCSGLTAVTLPVNLSSIEALTFQQCYNLESVTIPPNVTSIGSTAFAGCIHLTDVIIPPSVTTIGDYAFQNCFRLPNLTLPSSVTSIGEGAFSDCSELTSFTVPSGVITIGSNAFGYCYNLVSVEIPASVTSIGVPEFSRCERLISITVDPTNSVYSSMEGVLFDKNQTRLIEYPQGKAGGVVIPESVTSIGDYAFDFCNGLSYIELPSGVVSIGIEAFYGCDGLTAVTIPSSVTSIGTDAFVSCGSLMSACFVGNSPIMGFSVFDDSGSGFAVYFFNGSSGFSFPTWMGYPAVNMGAPSHVVPWLLENGFVFNESMQADSNHDGVSLLMAYALNLDPRLNLSGSMPQAVIAGNQLSLSFYGVSEGVSYAVECSDDLEIWSAEDVVLSEPDAGGMRTATVERTSPVCFMRVGVVY